MSGQYAGTVSAVMVREALLAPLQQGWDLQDLLDGTPFSAAVLHDDAARVPVQHYALLAALAPYDSR